MAKQIDWQMRQGLVTYGNTPAGDYLIAEQPAGYVVEDTPFKTQVYLSGSALVTVKALCQQHFDDVIRDCQ